jgi:hypothetical protein
MEAQYEVCDGWRIRTLHRVSYRVQRADLDERTVIRTGILSSAQSALFSQKPSPVFENYTEDIFPAPSIQGLYIPTAERKPYLWCFVISSLYIVGRVSRNAYAMQSLRSPQLNTVFQIVRGSKDISAYL